MTSEPLSAFKLASSRYTIEKYSEVTLSVRLSTNAATIYNIYDFVGRTLITQNGSTGSSPVVTPFSQLDRESLEFMHAQLVKLGGEPPALPVREDEKTRPALSKPRAAA
ncbi:MAG: hypothetical protein Q8K65_11190 [Alphaproteobacteria bacterium]|nr:hypothetical protein [Alphaproteobacteria bacterium]